MLGFGIGLGLVTALGSVNIMGKATNSKWHLNLLFVFTLMIYSLVIIQEMQSETKLLNLFFFALVLPICFSAFQSTKTVLNLLVLEISGFLVSCIVLWYLDRLDSENLGKILDNTDKVIQVATQGFCSYLIVYGYSFIPELLITPALNRTFKKANLESQQYSNERARNHISFDYTSKGLPTPKNELFKLKLVEREAEVIRYKLDKLNKNSISAQVFMISTGFFMLVCGFWVFSLLTGVLVEDIVVSKCGFLCGFDAESRIAKWVEGYYEFFFIVSGVFYLFACLFGYVWKLQDDFKEITNNIILSFAFITVSCGFSIRTFYSFFDSEAFPAAFRITQFVIHVLMVVGTFFLFIYWHFLKCKN